MRGKGKQRIYLYNIRKHNKRLRRKRRLKKKRNASLYSASGAYKEPFKENENKKVIRHLNKKKFAETNMLHIAKEHENIVIPEIFSMSDSPEIAINVLKNIYKLAMQDRTKELNFDHRLCRVLGLSASTIMDIIILAVDEYRDKSGMPLDMMGEYPVDKSTRDILFASGLPYHLNAESNIDYCQGKIERFETIKGLHNDTGVDSGRIATDLTMYFNKCLRTQSFELNEDGLTMFSSILGEVVNNCEIHGGSEAVWYIQGHYQIDEGKDYGEMQLVFLNFGDTIYEGLKNSPSKETVQKLNTMTKAHRKYFDSSWNEETLFTVLALQDGISRLRTNKIAGYTTRGSGTVNMIEKFGLIGGSENGLKPEMSIVSGRTWIRFNEYYKMKSMIFRNDPVFGSGERKIIAFNDENDIYMPSNSDNVIFMKNYFPGTVISLKFYLDSRYINKMKGNKV